MPRKRTTKEAFKELISQRQWYNHLGFSPQTASSIKQRFKDGSLTIDKMEELLEQCGYKVAQEKLWMKED